jgi:hypothetical protein
VTITKSLDKSWKTAFTPGTGTAKICRSFTPSPSDSKVLMVDFSKVSHGQFLGLQNGDVKVVDAPARMAAKMTFQKWTKECGVAKTEITARMQQNHPEVMTNIAFEQLTKLFDHYHPPLEGAPPAVDFDHSEIFRVYRNALRA